MPLVRISLLKGKSAEDIKAISDGVQRGLVEAFEAPEDDRFQLIEQRERDELIYDASYLGIARTDELVVIHIVASDWRSTVQKKALYRTITDNLVRNAHVRAEDVLIVLSPNGKEDWSFGHGLASYVQDAA